MTTKKWYEKIQQNQEIEEKNGVKRHEKSRDDREKIDKEKNGVKRHGKSRDDREKMDKEKNGVKLRNNIKARTG